MVCIKKQPYIYFVRLTFKNRHFFRYLTCLLDRGHIKSSASSTKIINSAVGSSGIIFLQLERHLLGSSILWQSLFIFSSPLERVINFFFVMPNPFINHCNKFISQAKASLICDIIGSDCRQENLTSCQTCKKQNRGF